MRLGLNDARACGRKTGQHPRRVQRVTAAHDSQSQPRPYAFNVPTSLLPDLIDFGFTELSSRTWFSRDFIDRGSSSRLQVNELSDFLWGVVRSEGFCD